MNHAQSSQIRFVFFFSSRRRHTRSYGDWSSDVCSSDLSPINIVQLRTSMTSTVSLKRTVSLSRVLDTNPADPATAHSHFSTKLAFETDPSDVYTDLQNDIKDITVVDARTPEAFAKGHVPGSINLPHRKQIGRAHV